MNIKRNLFLLSIITINTLSALELDPINVESTFENTALEIVDEELQINNQTLSEKLFNNIHVNQIDSATNAKVLSIRGNNFRATEYFEDGIPLYKTTNGFVDLSMYNDDTLFIDLNLGGAQSLYAPSAVGGEIILSSKKLKNGFNGSVDTSVSTNTSFLNTLLSYKTDAYYFKAMFSTLKQNSFTLSDKFTSTEIQQDDRRVNADKEQVNAYLKMGYKIDKNSDFAIKISHLHGKFGLPINIYNEPSNSFGTNADYMRVDDKQLNSYWFYYDYTNHKISLKLRSYYDRYTDTFNFYTTPKFTDLRFDESVYKDSRLGSILSLGYKLSKKHSSKVTLTVDKNSHKQNASNTSEHEEYETIDSSLSYLHTYKYTDKLIATASLRYKIQNATKVFEFNNENLDYGDNEAIDAQLTLNYEQNKQLSYYISIAHKNRFASLVELYPFFPWDIPTQHVKPEKSNNIEIGSQFILLKDTDIKLSAYYNEIDNMILFDGIQYENSQKVTIKGFELSAYNYSLKNNEIAVSYSYTNAQDKDKNKIIHIPTSKLNIVDKISIASDINFLLNYLYSSSVDDTYNSNTYTLNNYSLVDMQLAYSPSNQTTFKIGLKNLFDTNWESRYAQPSEGRSFFANFKYSF